MVIALALILALATAGEDGPDEAEVPADPDEVLVGPRPVEGDVELDEDDDHTIIVYRELLVEQARRKVIADLRQEGYTRTVERDGYTILRHDASWRGEVRLYDDGWVEFRRQPLQIEAPRIGAADRNSVGAWMACTIFPLRCIRAGGWFVGPRKLHAVERRTLAVIQDDVHSLGDRVADMHVERTVDDLPARLEALWEDGVPLEGDDPLPTHEDRRAALLAYWDSRTDSPWGESVRQAIESFLRGVVQPSEHPFTDDELAAFEAQRTAPRPLALRVPVEEE